MTFSTDTSGKSDSPAQLTPREAEVMMWVLRGLTNKAIAQKLAVSEFTARDQSLRIRGEVPRLLRIGRMNDAMHGLSVTRAHIVHRPEAIAAADRTIRVNEGMAHA